MAAKWRQTFINAKDYRYEKISFDADTFDLMQRFRRQNPELY
ncbi:hypothetical protein BN18_0071 [Klebsiella pneumoniae subsp. pneumoniae ST512-K30BO]|nr:hypothetical protein CSC40_2693 [Klebsiella pneumoniae]CCM81240.1 hypothetical protein BN426_0750 [Klebsiella pneumoniae subsp. pneumoniae ST258-K26BO]CCM91790.1 hypothetical protein BN18_0071 [Klebsiella pneumoniae subsp. pneumoniae ST512-K30BO]CDL55323.1 hypothetical protein [Klebsiella pneumoniae]CDL59235.1 hypothetical protein [Klebsiella pneumoniae]